jgi:hypothetical protein
MNKNTFKSIAAVLAGFVTDLVLSIGTDTILEKLGIFPPQNDPGSFVPWMLVLALFYRSIYAVAGGYVTTALAPDRPMRHAVILGIIGLIIGTFGTIENWNTTSASAAWYPILLILLSLPCVWLGGKLRTSLGTNKT